MFQVSSLSVWQVLNMTMAIVLRFHLSDEAHQAILELIKVLAGPDFKNFSISKYNINKLFSQVDDFVKYIFYCTVCNTRLAKPIPMNTNMRKKVQCKKCKKRYITSKKAENFFVTVDIKSQLKNLLSKSTVQNLINNNNRNQVPETITDVYDSQRYINDEYMKSIKTEEHISLTLNVNLDGAPLFKSSKKSFWPIQCIVNEIPQSIRHTFMLLAGLWYTSVEPKADFMNLYLKSFVTQIKNLMKNGIKIVTEAGNTITYYCTIFTFPVDSVARPILQNRLQFNGFFGCSWCYHHGMYNSRSMKYPLTSENVRERTHERYTRDVEQHKKLLKKLPKTKKNKKFTRKGIKGSTILSSLPNFDCVWGFPPDYMHGVLLGVTRQLWDEWSKNFLSNESKKLINERLTNIQPPNEIHRTPRVLQHKHLWKASEWRSWLLFYSIPVLTGILQPELLDSYKLFVRSIHKMLSKNITEEELVNCEIDLLKFCYDCQNQYGLSFMTFNVHSLLHLPESVRKNGPLWASSAYVFENNIFNLKLNVSSPNGVLSQMATRMLRYNAFQSRLSTESNEPSWEYCRNVINKKSLNAKNGVRSEDGALMSSCETASINSSISTYGRCIYKGTVYTSKSYTKSKKTNNSFVLLDDNRKAEISDFFIENKRAYVNANILHVIQVQ
ncbi:GSCOCG00012392001-RA-CDS, partial [Cotesia congregata]